MILKILGIENDIIILNDKPTILVIEETNLMTKFIADLYFEAYENDVIFINDMEKVDYKEIVLITDVFSFDINDKKYINLLYKEIEIGLKEEFDEYILLQNKFLEIVDLLSNSILDIELDLEYNDGVDIKDLLKIIKLRFSLNQTFDIFNKFLLIIDLISFCNLEKLYIFANVLIYFDDDQIKKIFKYISIKKLRILFVEKQDINIDIFSRKYLIDDEFC